MTEKILSALGGVDEKYILPYGEKVGAKRAFPGPARRWVALAAALALVIAGGAWYGLSLRDRSGHNYPVELDDGKKYDARSRSFDSLDEMLDGSSAFPGTVQTRLYALELEACTGVRFRSYGENGNNTAAETAQGYEVEMRRNGVRCFVLWRPGYVTVRLPKRYMFDSWTDVKTEELGAVTVVSGRNGGRIIGQVYEGAECRYTLISCSADAQDFYALLNDLLN